MGCLHYYEPQIFLLIQSIHLTLILLIENVICLLHYAAYIQMHSRLILSWKQTLWTLIRLLLMEQSNPGPYCLQYRPLKYISRRERRQQ